LAATEEWWPYDLPPYDGPPHAMCAFRGQTQRWVAFRFEGDEARIDVTHPPPPHQPEFSSWAWLPLATLPDLVTAHKRENYRRVVEAFSRFATPLGNVRSAAQP
jgi:putative (di)nucleoside polyphosphate hydrolase